MEISLLTSPYDEKVNNAKGSAIELSAEMIMLNSSCPEIPAMDVYEQGFERLNQTLWQYKTLLLQGLERMTEVKEQLVEAEKKLIG